MKPGIINGIKNLLSKRSVSLTKLHISWFGGEPLLASDICLDISSFAKSLAMLNGHSFSSSMTTNGYKLSPQMLTSLNDVGVRNFQISLDGDEASHNNTRLRADGKGTFDVIWANLLAARATDLDFHITLRIHVHRENVDSVMALKKRTNNEIGPDGRFSTFYHKVEHLGGAANKASLLSENEYRLALEVINPTPSIEGHKIKPSSELDISDYICYAAKPNSLLIRADGRLGKCTVLLSDARNDIGYIDNEGLLHVNDQRFQAWLEGFRDLDPRLLSCPVRGLGRAAEHRLDKEIPVLVEVA